MPYRDYELPTGQRVKTRISDEATLEWFLAWLQSGGSHTNRPPDVDTDLHRLWLSKNDSRENFGLVAKGGPLATFTCTTHFDSGHKKTVKLLLAFGENDELQMVIRGQRQPSGEDFMNLGRTFKPDQMQEADEALQEGLEMVTLASGALGDETHWMIALPDYFIGLRAEIDVAETEFRIETETNGPLPELAWGPHFEFARASLQDADLP